MIIVVKNVSFIHPLIKKNQNSRKRLWYKIKLTPKFLLYRLTDIWLMYKLAPQSHLDFFRFWFNCAIHNSLSFLNSLFLCTLQQEETNGYDITPEFFFIINDEILLTKLLLYNVSIPLSPHSPGLYFPIRENVRHG